MMMTENSTPTAETGGPGVGLAAEERNGRGQMLDEKSKKQTRDGFCIPGLIAEPTGTDGFRVLCHQFFPSSLSRRETCLKNSKTFWLKRNKLREALYWLLGTSVRKNRQLRLLLLSVYLLGT